jgi:two-component system chemotaxis response regulator CheB
MIRVLLVDDSPIALHLLQRLLLRVPDIEVAGTASNGHEALGLLKALAPDVVCTDLHMPEMSGLELTRHIMRTQPCPILVVSVSVEPGSPNVFQLLEAGALDVFPKPRDIERSDPDVIARELASKIRILAGVHVFRRKETGELPRPEFTLQKPTSAQRILVIGASTGGPVALRTVLSALPAAFPWPVLCVQHISKGFMAELMVWLAGCCRLKVAAARPGERPQPGIVHFAPEDTHLQLNDKGCFELSIAPPVEGHRPSVSVSMQSAAQRYGANAVGVLLTGMGRDGAEGMLAISRAGGITISQDEASCVVYGMPKAAVGLGAVQYELPLENIAPALISLATGSASRGRAK